MAFIIVVVSASFFTWALPIVSEFRVGHPYVMFGMPLLVFLIWWDRKQPNDVISTRAEVAVLRDSISNQVRPVRIAAGFKQVFKTLAAHFVGASVGREAVGIQLGGWAARLRSIRGWHLGACIAAGFAIVLGTPFAASVFVFESKRWKLSLREWLAIPLLSYLAYRISLILGVVHSEYHPFSTTWTELTSIGWLRLLPFVTVLIICSMALAALFLNSLERASNRVRGLKNDFVLPLMFLSLVMFVFYAIGFSKVEILGLPGLGVQSMGQMFLLEPDLVRWTDHPLLIAVLKVFLTAAFVGIGVRGGELTPLLFAGGALSVGLGLLFGFPIASLVALGFPLLWGIAARRPIAAGFLAVEIFGFGPYASLGIFTVLAVFVGMKAGDVVELMRNRGGTSAWRRGLYD